MKIVAFDPSAQNMIQRSNTPTVQGKRASQVVLKTDPVLDLLLKEEHLGATAVPEEILFFIME